MFGWKHKKTKEEQSNRRERIAKRNQERAAQRLAERDAIKVRKGTKAQEETQVLREKKCSAKPTETVRTDTRVHAVSVRAKIQGQESMARLQVGERRPKRQQKSHLVRKVEKKERKSNTNLPNLKQLFMQRLEENRKRRFRKRTKPIAKMTPQMNLKREEVSKKKTSWLSGLTVAMSYDIGIDLGTSNVLMYVKGRGLVLNEPSFVARDTRTKEIIAVGQEARTMWGRTPQGIEVFRPLQAGVISDYDTTEFMLRYFIRSVVPESALLRTRIVACVPSGITPVGKRAILEALLRTGAKKTVLIEEPLAAAMGTGLDEAKNVGAMVVDMGGGTTDIAVVCESGVVVSESLQIGGDTFDKAICQHLQRRRKLLIGMPTAQAIKLQAGTVDRKATKTDVLIRGRDLQSGLPKAILLPSSEVQQAIKPHMMSILEGIKNILEKTPPELVASIADHGILLTGGSALLDGVDRIITRVIGVAAYVVEEPEFAVIKGTAKALQDMAQLQDTLEELQ